MLHFPVTVNTIEDNMKNVENNICVRKAKKTANKILNYITEYSLSGNSRLTCCAYSKRETMYGAGGSRPGNTALLIESKASVKSPHSIIVPTLLKSVSVAWMNERTM